MGRRSINTTKSGKYMNPTDQARKEARKRELKKNKKQRQMVRMAVLKSKDPLQILQDMEKIDLMEYSVDQPPVLNEKVLKDKRKKLKETLHRVLKLYEREEPEKWVEIRREEAEYEKRRHTMLAFYESVRHAQSVALDEIPLPLQSLNAIPLPQDIPLPMPIPNHHMIPQHSILKKRTLYGTELGLGEPPGVPPGPPPELSEEEDEEDEEEEQLNPPGEDLYDPERDAESGESSDEGELSDDDDAPAKYSSDEEKTRRRKVKFEDSDSDSEEEEKNKAQPSALQQKMLALAGQDVDQFMKEMEEVHKAREARKEQERAKLEKEKAKREKELPQAVRIPAPLMFRPPGPPPLPRPPPPGIRLAPGPPPGVPPPRGALRMPPGPPPGIPSHLVRQPVTAISAAPQLINRTQEPAETSTTIQAKPQIRNLSAELVKMVPTAVRVRREGKRPVHRNVRAEPVPMATSGQQPSKDDAYSQFMKEMEGLM